MISSLSSSSQFLLPASHCFIIGKDLICQLVHKLIKAQIHLGEKKQNIVRVSPAHSSSFLCMQDQYHSTESSNLIYTCMSHYWKTTLEFSYAKDKQKIAGTFLSYSFCMFLQILVPHPQSPFPVRDLWFLIFYGYLITLCPDSLFHVSSAWQLLASSVPHGYNWGEALNQQSLQTLWKRWPFKTFSIWCSTRR